jgi:hypothetical protein
MPELSLDDDERDAFAGHLDRVCVAQLARGEASAHDRPGGGAAELGACAAGGPRASARASVDDAEQWTDRQATRTISHGSSSCQPQSSIPTSRRRPPLPRRTRIEPRRRSRSASRSASASSMRRPARHNDDQPAEPPAVPTIAGDAHDRDDLLDGGRVGWIAQAFVARRTTGMKGGHRRRRAPTTGGIENRRSGQDLYRGYDRQLNRSPPITTAPRAVPSRNCCLAHRATALGDTTGRHRHCSVAWIEVLPQTNGPAAPVRRKRQRVGRPPRPTLGCRVAVQRHGDDTGAGRTIRR